MANGVPIQDLPEYTTIFRHDNYFDRLALILVYSNNPKRFIEEIKKLDKQDAKKMIGLIKAGNSYHQSACLAYLEYFVPDFDCDFNSIKDSISNKVQLIIESLVSQNLETDNVIGICQPVVQELETFMIEFGQVRETIGMLHGKYGDYEDLLDSSISNINIALSYLKEENVNEVESILEEHSMNPFIHCAIAEKLDNNVDSCLSFFNDILNKISILKEQIPDYASFFTEQKDILQKIGIEFANNYFPRLNTYYFTVKGKTAPQFVRNSFISFIDFMVGETEPTQIDDKAQTMEKNLLQTINKLRLFCARMRLPMPQINEEKSEYKLTDEELQANQMKNKMIEIQEMEEHQIELKDAINELKKYNSTCTVCRKYVSSYICPHCHLLLYCLICKKTNQPCPNCKKFFEEPLRINKTCYFGEEFQMEARGEIPK